MSRSRFISDVRSQPYRAHKTEAVATPDPIVVSAPQVIVGPTARVAPRKGTRRAPLKRSRVRGMALTSLASVLFIFGIGVGVNQMLTDHKVKVQVQTLAATTTTELDNADSGVPVETKPKTGLNNYFVAPELPRIIRITNLKVEARIIPLGVTANNELKAPSSIFDAGWYQGSARPGETGAVLINGHVHGPTQPGVFVGLKKLRSGDKISIERGDGKVLTYHVVKSQSYSKDNVDMGAAFSSAEPGKPGLNLMTCDGAYDAQGHYANRLIVFAVQDV